MPLISKPKYPVVDPDPSIGRIMGNFSSGDVMSIFGFTGAGFATGFFGCKCFSPSDSVHGDECICCVMKSISSGERCNVF